MSTVTRPSRPRKTLNIPKHTKARIERAEHDRLILALLAVQMLAHAWCHSVAHLATFPCHAIWAARFTKALRQGATAHISCCF